jgi:hypothetical protein
MSGICSLGNIGSSSEEIYHYDHWFYMKIDGFKEMHARKQNSSPKEQQGVSFEKYQSILVVRFFFLRRNFILGLGSGN